MVPLLVAWFALDQRRASATSLLAIVPIATASAAGYAGNGNVDLRAGVLLLSVAWSGGSWAPGCCREPRSPPSSCGSGCSAWPPPRGSCSGATPSARAGLGGAWEAGCWLVGVAAGVLAGLLGVGGGIVMVPGLVILAGDDADTARGTSLLVVIFTALTATVTNLRNDLVEARLGWWPGLSGGRQVWWVRPWASGCPSVGPGPVRRAARVVRHPDDPAQPPLPAVGVIRLRGRYLTP